MASRDRGLGKRDYEFLFFWLFFPGVEAGVWKRVRQYSPQASRLQRILFPFFAPLPIK